MNKSERPAFGGTLTIVDVVFADPMPTLKIIDGTKIDVYSREHPPPHFHAINAEDEELIVIDTLETYVGELPGKKRKKVIEWASGNQDFLMKNFKRLNPNL